MDHNISFTPEEMTMLADALLSRIEFFEKASVMWADMAAEKKADGDAKYIHADGNAKYYVEQAEAAKALLTKLQ